jgi:hypothetical protein
MMPSSLPTILSMALASSPYERAKESAQVVRNLGRFLEEYVGDCEHDEPTFNKVACESTAKKARDRYGSGTLVIEIEDVAELIRVQSFDAARQTFQLLITPFFSERGLGMSVGKPTRLTPEGFPVVKNVPVTVRLPKGEQDFVFRRQLDRGMVKLELLVRPKNAWRMTKRDGEAVRGAEVALVGVRVYGSSGNGLLAEQTY